MGYDCRLCVPSRAYLYSFCKKDCENVPQELSDIKSFKLLIQRDMFLYRVIKGRVKRLTLTLLMETNPKLKPYILPYLTGKRPLEECKDRDNLKYNDQSMINL